MLRRKNVCVYCASSADVDACFTDAAAKLGRLLARKGIGCVCGAGRTGLMGALADGCLAKGGTVTGVIPHFMVELGWGHEHLSHVEETEDMHKRKERMAALSDAAVALPGGCGTMEELMEIITWKQLGLYSKPVIIVNTRGYYTPLLQMLEQAVRYRFMKESHRHLWHVADSPEEVIDLLENLPEDEAPAESKY